MDCVGNTCGSVAFEVDCFGGSVGVEGYDCFIYDGAFGVDCAALGAGGPRYDIDGRPSGMISPDDQQAAVEALQRRLVRSPQAIARRQERKIAAAAQS